MLKPKTDLLDRTFEISILLKGIDGVLEVVGGLLLLFLTPATTDRLVVALTQHELTQDSHDFLATPRAALREWSDRIRGLPERALPAIHGVVKIVLVFALLRTQLWA